MGKALHEWPSFDECIVTGSLCIQGGDLYFAMCAGMILYVLSLPK